MKKKVVPKKRRVRRKKPKLVGVLARPLGHKPLSVRCIAEFEPGHDEASKLIAAGKVLIEHGKVLEKARLSDHSRRSSLGYRVYLIGNRPIHIDTLSQMEYVR